jgi:hypothetical protein
MRSQKSEDEDRKLLFKADESKMLNCVPAPAAAQHIEASIKWDPFPS